ncbi:MAG: hypothetical protein ACE5MI_05030 [Acidimicrobiia bacterium]
MTVLESAPLRQGSLLDVARLLIVVQGAIKLLSVFEVIVVGLALGTISLLGPTLLLTAAASLLAFVIAAALGRRARWARRLAIIGEVLALSGAAVDLLLSLVLGQGLLEPVPLAMGLVIPATVIWILRRKDVKGEFGTAISVEAES